VCSINTCLSGEYFTGGLCRPYSTCAAGTYRSASMQGTPSTLRCTDPAVNPNAESGPCFYTTDTPCLPWSSCAGNQYQLNGPTSTSDRCVCVCVCSVQCAVCVRARVCIEIYLSICE
jgi:hypothetical protein